jgi:3-hydroxyisobutyrate dehydrogenase-like beta-hydroxyacid dehydrogenase
MAPCPLNGEHGCGNRITLIGYGEAGSTFARAGDWQGAAAHDLKPERRALAIEDGLRAPGDAAAALAGADFVLSLVTADAALSAAEACAPLLKPGAIWADGTSVAPETSAPPRARWRRRAGAMLIWRSGPG